MLLTRQNAKGGPKLKKCPIDTDYKTGHFGYRIGYCGGCNEPILIRTIDLNEILMNFGFTTNECHKEGIRQKLIKLLGGVVENSNF